MAVFTNKLNTKLMKFIKKDHKGLYMKNISKIEPNMPICIILAVNFPGNKSNKICEPSNGGIGRRLNKNKKIFRNTPYQQKFSK